VLQKGAYRQEDLLAEVRRVLKSQAGEAAAERQA
jgi:hypothetical protein